MSIVVFLSDGFSWHAQFSQLSHPSKQSAWHGHVSKHIEPSRIQLLMQADMRIQKLINYYITVQHRLCSSISFFGMTSHSTQTGVLKIVTFRKHHTEKRVRAA